MKELSFKRKTMCLSLMGRGAQTLLGGKKKTACECRLFLAGETRFEHATYGFGDRYSTVEPLPCAHCVLYRILTYSSTIFPSKTQKKE